MSVNRSEKLLERKQQAEAFEARQRHRRAQWVGVLAGAGLGMMAGSLIPWVRLNIELPALILWSGALGGMIGGWQGFEAAGKILTRSESRALNFGVGLGIPVLILLALDLLIKSF